MKNYYYTIGDVTFSFCSVEEGIAQTILSKREETIDIIPLCLSPTLLYDGELFLPSGEEHLLPEALCVASYHLSVTQGLPLYEYTFLFSDKKYNTQITKNGIVSIVTEKCKELFSNIRISKNEISVNADVYSTPYPSVVCEVSSIEYTNPCAFSILFSHDCRTKYLPFILYEKGGEMPLLHHYHRDGRPQANTLLVYSIYARKCFGNRGTLTLPFVGITLTSSEVRMKVSIKHSLPLD